MSELVQADGTEGPWDEVREAVGRTGRVVVHGLWQQWLPTALADPDLRDLLGLRDWTRFNGMSDPTVRSRFAASRMLARYVVGAVLRIRPADVEVSYKPGGRPYVRGCSQVEVSLSHTKDLIVVGVSRCGPIGVDTELSSRRISFDIVKNTLCTPTERARIAPLPEAEQERQLLQIWTLKEAYTKALGQGMRLSFRQFGFNADGTALHTSDSSQAGEHDWAFGTHWLPGGYVVSFVCRELDLHGVGDTRVETMLDAGLVGEIVDLLRWAEQS